MDLDAAQIDLLLRQTFDDQRLARSERRALKDLAASAPEAKLRLRRRAFHLAREWLGTHPGGEVLDWLEDVEKAIFEVEPERGGAEAWFSPHQEVWRRIVGALNGLRARADLAVFTITDDRIAAALLAAHGRGVRLRILSDDEKAGDPGSDIERLARAGVEVRIDRTAAHMHHKFALFDGAVLLNGSYNWTRSAANENHENLVFDPDPALVRAFEREFEHCWALAQPW